MLQAMANGQCHCGAPSFLMIAKKLGSSPAAALSQTATLKRSLLKHRQSYKRCWER